MALVAAVAVLGACLGSSVAAIALIDGDRRDRWLIAAVALGVRVFVGVPVAVALAATGRPWLFPDEGTYLREAAGVVPMEDHGYSRFLSLLFDVAGPSAWLPKGINLLAGVVLAVVMYEIAARLVDRRSARWVGLAVACWPSLALWSVLVLKDTLVLLSLFVAVLATLRAVEGRWAAVAWALVALAALEQLRPYAFTVAVIALVAPLVVVLARRCARPALPLAALFLAVTALQLATGHGVLGARFLTGNATVEQVAFARSEGLEGGTTFADPEVRSRRDVVVGIPRGAAYAVVGPFPWDPIPLTARALVALELPAWLAALGLAARGAWRARRPALLGSWSMLPAFALGIVAVLAVFENNAATALRQRATVIPVVLCLAAAGTTAQRAEAAETAAR